tara:strand:+ start:2571 stop:2690 length:120 start_codon:yes stop_codon:yes gene_type:complete
VNYGGFELECRERLCEERETVTALLDAENCTYWLDELCD